MPVSALVHVRAILKNNGILLCLNQATRPHRALCAGGMQRMAAGRNFGEGHTRVLGHGKAAGERATHGTALQYSTAVLYCTYLVLLYVDTSERLALSAYSSTVLNAIRMLAAKHDRRLQQQYRNLVPTVLLKYKGSQSPSCSRCIHMPFCPSID